MVALSVPAMASPSTLASVSGPISPVPGGHHGTTPILEEMYFQFDVLVNKIPVEVQETFSWVNVLEVGTWGQNTWYLSLWMSWDADQDTSAYPGWLMPDETGTWRGMGDPLVEGQSYHFEIEWTKTTLTIKINGVPVVDEKPSTHSTFNEVDIWMSGSPAWPVCRSRTAHSVQQS